MDCIRTLQRLFGKETEQLAAYRVDDELLEEDADTKKEREHVHNLSSSDYKMYPLLAKDIRKV